MKSPIVKALSVTCLLAAPMVLAQDAPTGSGRPRLGFLGRGTKTPPPPAVPGGAPTIPLADAKLDSHVIPAEGNVPEPTDPSLIQPATIVLPTDAIEPWLLTKEAGPFMVMARSFRGPEAERYALALAKEIRAEYGLPAYIMRTKDFPMRSFVRGIPPNAPPYMNKSQLSEPEKTRTHDEAAVLVGNEKTLEGSLKLLQVVRKINPKCLEQIPGIYKWRRGLSTATRTTNPYVPAQDLYPGRSQHDKLVEQMNAGPRSVYHCPGRFTLQVAEFTGRTVINPQDKDVTSSFFSADWLKSSPLRTAADDAERVADALAKDEQVQRTGFQPYVYHDRTSSKVMVGSFNDPKDPKAAALRDTMLRVAVAVTEKDKKRGVVMAPANYLTDLEDPNKPMKTTK